MKVSGKDRPMFINIRKRIEQNADALANEPGFIDHVGFIMNITLPNGNPAQVQIRITRSLDDFNNTRFYELEEEDLK